MAKISINEVKITLNDMSDSFEAKKCMIDETEDGVVITVKEKEYNNDGDDQ